MTGRHAGEFQPRHGFTPAPSAPAAWIAVATAAALMVTVLVIVVFRTSPSALAPPTWTTYLGDGFTVSLPGTPTASSAAGGAHSVTVVPAGSPPRAYAVVWFGVPAASAPGVDLARALAALGNSPDAVLSYRDGVTNIFASTDFQARLASGYLTGRLMIVGQRAYLVGELTRTATRPADLDRLLAGFAPDPASAA